MKNLIPLLAVGDRRTTGKSAQISRAVLRNPELFDQVFDAMWQNEDAGVRMRASNVCEAVTRTRPELLQARKRDFLTRVAPITQQEVRWHVCQMLPRLKLSRAERRRAFEMLETFLNDKSSIVRTFAMQAMADLAREDDALRAGALKVIQEAARTGTPAMRSRARILLKEFPK